MVEQNNWILVALTVPWAAEELASSLLFDLGTTGIVTLSETEISVQLGAYFRVDVSVDQTFESIQNAFADFESALLTPPQINVSEVQNQDWMRKWKEGFEATEVGEKFLVAPSWKIGEITSRAGSADAMAASEAPQANQRPVRTVGERLIIQIDPGMAFGTGTHESTRLCLQAIERYWQGEKLLDVGTGTGILAIGAALLRPGSQVTGIDIDPLAIEVAQENVAINFGAAGGVHIVEGQPKGFAGRGFDVVVANLTAEVIVDLLADLNECLTLKGTLIMSGILTELTSIVTEALEQRGLHVVEQQELGEWASIVARRQSANRAR